MNYDSATNSSIFDDNLRYRLHHDDEIWGVEHHYYAILPFDCQACQAQVAERAYLPLCSVLLCGAMTCNHCRALLTMPEHQPARILIKVTAPDIPGKPLSRAIRVGQDVAHHLRRPFDLMTVFIHCSPNFDTERTESTYLIYDFGVDRTETESEHRHKQHKVDFIYCRLMYSDDAPYVLRLRTCIEEN